MQCTATSKGSGVRCRKDAIAGGSVCRNHGGAAPQVRNAAVKRLHDAVNSAVANLLEKQKSKLEAVSLRATQDILDRNNMKGENIIRLMMGESSSPEQKGLTDEQSARFDFIPPDKLAVFDEVLAFIETGEWPSGPGHSSPALSSAATAVIDTRAVKS